MTETHIDMGMVDNSLVIHVCGRGTAEYCPELDARIKDFFSRQEVSHVFFDTHEASYMDSSFIGMILAVKKRLKNMDAVFLLNPDVRISEIFEIMGLSDFIPTVHMDNMNPAHDTCEIHKKLENSLSDMRLLLEAHRNIMETSEENNKRFIAVEKALKTEIDKKFSPL